MPNRYLLSIHLDRLLMNRRPSDGTPQAWTEEDALRWLAEVGLVETEAGWMCGKPPLHLLQPGEYAIVDRY